MTDCVSESSVAQVNTHFDADPEESGDKIIILEDTLML